MVILLDGVLSNKQTVAMIDVNLRAIEAHFAGACDSRNMGWVNIV